VFARALLSGLAAVAVVLILAAASLRAQPESRGEGRILFAFGESGSDHPAQAAVMDGDGKHRRVLRGVDHVLGASWSPDDRSIAFDRLGPVPRRNIYRPNVWTMNVDGRPRFRRVVRNGGTPAWSPSGRRIAFVRGRDIWLADLNGRRQRRIIRHGRSPQWSPEGEKLAFERGGSQSSIWVADVAAKKERRLVRNGDDAQWSPDGREIAFDRCVTQGLDTECFVYAMRADGSGQHRLFKGQEPLWSPNGQELAFVGADERRSLNDAIIRARLDGSGRRILFGQQPYCGCYLLAWGASERRPR
jgi:Tol biopolymer transport system component